MEGTLGQEDWLDVNEQHYGFQFAFRTLVAANLSLFEPKHMAECFFRSKLR